MTLKLKRPSALVSVRQFVFAILDTFAFAVPGIFAFAVFGTFAFAAVADPIPVYRAEPTSNASDQTYLQVPLTHDIYRYSSSPTLADLMVLDQQGNRLPFRVATPEQGRDQQPQLTDVRFFPVAVGASSEMLLALSSSSIKLEDNAISVTVEKTDKPELVNETAPVDFYLVDLSDWRQRIDALHLDWTAGPNNQYLEVEISGTNDLQNWRSLQRGTLVQLEKGDNALRRTRVPLNLSPQTYAYLKVTILRGDKQAPLTQIKIEQTNASAPVAMDRWILRGEKARQQKSALPSAPASKTFSAWEFIRDDLGPASEVTLDFGTQSYGDTLRIFSRATEKQQWQLRYDGIWFNAQVGGDWQHSEPVRLLQNADLYWRVETTGALAKEFQPRLSFAQPVQALQFIANNNGPFTIAIDQTQTSNQSSREIFTTLTQGKDTQWTGAKMTNLDPDMGLFVRKQPGVDWRSLLFWSLLILAVLTLAGFCLRLYRQMNPGAAVEDQP